MAFPQVEATSTGSDTTSGSGTVTLPTGVTAGDRLVMVVDVDNGNLSDIIISASGTGWNKLAQESDAGAVRSALFEKQSASGDSADDVTISFSGQSIAEACSYTVYRISGHDSSAALEYSVQSHTDVGDTNPSANPDAPSLTPSWGSADTLWMWAGCWDNATRTISAFPTNYSSNQTTNTGASGASGDVTVAIATRENAASSEDPGTATISAAEQWNAWTIAIKPAGSGGASVSVPAGSLSLTANAPTVTAGGAASVAVPAGALSLSAFAPTVTNAATDNIRLQPSLYLERGGYAASLTADRWIVFTSDLSAVEDTGTALSINSTGQPTIDITGSASYVVGDQVPLFITVYDEGSDPQDRTVRTFFGWVEAIAQA